MPAASYSQRQANLKRLQGALTAHCPADASRVTEAKRYADHLPLTHATSIGKLPTVLRSGALRSQQEINQRVGEAEDALDTRDDVFLYAGAFTYPGTECGFLFLRSVETDPPDYGVSTPFDSGALASKIPPPAPYADGVTFVRDHELPVPDYRDLLADVIARFLPSADAYLHQASQFACGNCGTPLPHPFGLVGGDRRAATFELRLPKQVPLVPPHLRAVFVREGFEIPELSALFALGVPIVRFPAEDGADFFHALRTSCITFIADHVLP